MPDESRVVVLDVDLSCSRCDKKIRKVLEKNREEWNIRNISYDVKNKEVKISGPFDPHQLVKKLCKRASDVIREWCIKEPEKPKPPPPKPEPPKPDPTPPPPKPEPPKPDPPKPEPPKPEPPKPEPPKPPKPEPPKPCPDPPCHPTCYPLPYPYPFPYYLPWGGCDGHHKPCSSGCGCSGGCDGHHKPCSSGCGCSGGCSGTYQPQPTYVDYGRPRQWVCEEEPAVACNIM